MTRVYGRSKTHLTLTGKAADYYAGTDPLTIIEHVTGEDDDEYTYTIKEPMWGVTKPITESELISFLEGWADASDSPDIDD